jgi:hypothetical protein
MTIMDTPFDWKAQLSIAEVSFETYKGVEASSDLDPSAPKPINLRHATDFSELRSQSTFLLLPLKRMNQPRSLIFNLYGTPTLLSASKLLLPFLTILDIGC